MHGHARIFLIAGTEAFGVTCASEAINKKCLHSASTFLACRRMLRSGRDCVSAVRWVYWWGSLQWMVLI